MFCLGSLWSVYYMAGWDRWSSRFYNRLTLNNQMNSPGNAVQKLQLWPNAALGVASEPQVSLSSFSRVFKDPPTSSCAHLIPTQFLWLPWVVILWTALMKEHQNGKMIMKKNLYYMKMYVHIGLYFKVPYMVCFLTFGLLISLAIKQWAPWTVWLVCCG